MSGLGALGLKKEKELMNKLNELTSSKIKLSVIIPAYNEAANLKKGSLAEVNEYLKAQKYTYEVIVVDDGSTDNTADLIEKETARMDNFRLIRNAHGGKAVTVMSGLLEARGEIAVFTDMDQATPIKEIEKFLPKFEEGYDIVIGSRDGRKGSPVVRKLLAWGFITLRNIIMSLPFKDTQCGFKAFNQKSIQAVIPQLLDIWKNNKKKGAAVNAGFDVELLFLASRKNLKIAEVLVEWRHVQSERIQAVSDALDALSDMVRIRILSLLGRYN